MKYYKGMPLKEFIYKNYGFSLTSQQQEEAQADWDQLQDPAFYWEDAHSCYLGENFIIYLN